MSCLRSVGVLLRQVTAHDGYVIRRAAAEAAAAVLARLGPRVPGAARAAAWLHPGSPESQRALAERATKRGDTEAASRHRAEAERLAHNTLETAVLDTLRDAIAQRRRRRAPARRPSGVGHLLESRQLDLAAQRARASRVGVGSHIDDRIAVAAAALEAGRPRLAGELALEATRLDRGRADAWRVLGRAALESGDLESARVQLETASALDPGEVEVLALLGDAWHAEDRERARRLWWRALERAPDADAVLRRLEAGEGARDGTELELALVSGPARLELGQCGEVALEARVRGGPAALYVLPAFGAGIACEPSGRVPLAEGDSPLRVALRAERPDRVNGGRPWSVRFALCDGERIASTEVGVAVPDREPGRVYYLVTEDHELYDEREAIEAHVARTTLVDKSRLAERIANEQGARWTHMVDVGSLALVEWAAERSGGGEWRGLSRDCSEHLVEAVARDNDLGLHIHAFHDPTSEGFCHGFDAAENRVTTSPEFLEQPLPRRGFWSRAFPAQGDVDEPGTRAWATWRAIGRLEAVGRLGDPRFRVALFRAGSFDLGEDAADRARSLALLQRLGILADSDAPKPRLYHRVLSNATYPVCDDPCRPEPDPARFRALELRPEFNVEADFLSDVRVLNAYVDRRLEDLQREGAGSVAPGVHIVCSMTHDKFINWRMGRQWDSLDPDYADWATIRDHLRHVRTRHPEVRFATTREAVLAWYDSHAPELVAWRDEEVVELGVPGAATETFRYSIRLLGRDVPVSAERPRRVVVHAPAWLGDRIREAWIERDGERWAAQALPAGPLRLAFRVDDRAADFELVVVARAGDGIRAEPLPRETGTLRLSSGHGYRRATVEVPEGLAPGGERRRIRGVALARTGDHYEGRLALDAPARRDRDG